MQLGLCGTFHLSLVQRRPFSCEYGRRGCSCCGGCASAIVKERVVSTHLWLRAFNDAYGGVGNENRRDFTGQRCCTHDRSRERNRLALNGTYQGGRVTRWLRDMSRRRLFSYGFRLLPLKSWSLARAALRLCPFSLRSTTCLDGERLCLFSLRSTTRLDGVRLCPSQKTFAFDGTRQQAPLSEIVKISTRQSCKEVLRPRGKAGRTS